MNNRLYIEYLNRGKNFAVDRKYFTGPDAEDNAIAWGRENLSNFHIDMVKSERIEKIKRNFKL